MNFLPLVVLRGLPRPSQSQPEPMGALEWHLMRASEVPLAALVIVLGAAAIIWCIYKIVAITVEDVLAWRAQEAERRQARGEAEEILAEVEIFNQEIIEKIDELTALARRQIAGETIADEAKLVNEGFDLIEEVMEEFSKPELRTWAKAVVDRYRFGVRRLVEGIDTGADPVIVAEMLEDLHRITVVDLSVRQTKDGAVVAKVPRHPDGTPFDLQKAQEAYEKAKAERTSANAEPKVT